MTGFAIRLFCLLRAPVIWQLGNYVNPLDQAKPSYDSRPTCYLCMMKLNTNSYLCNLEPCAHKLSHFKRHLWACGNRTTVTSAPCRPDSGPRQEYGDSEPLRMDPETVLVILGY